MMRMLLRFSLAVAVGWFLVPASLESLTAALEGLAAEPKVLPLPPGDALKLVGGVALLVAMWRWTTPKSPPQQEVGAAVGEGRVPAIL